MVGRGVALDEVAGRRGSRDLGKKYAKKNTCLRPWRLLKREASALNVIEEGAKCPLPRIDFTEFSSDKGDASTVGG